MNDIGICNVSTSTTGCSRVARLTVRHMTSRIRSLNWIPSTYRSSCAEKLAFRRLKEKTRSSTRSFITRALPQYFTQKNSSHQRTAEPAIPTQKNQFTVEDLMSGV